MRVPASGPRRRPRRPGQPGHARPRSIALGLSLTLASLSVTATDLVDIYEVAKGYDATLQAARFDHESARLRVPLARSAFLPQLQAGAAGALTDFNSDDSDTYESSQLSLVLTQTLFNRVNSSLLGQAEIGLLEADARLAASVQDLILRVATAYFDVLRAESNVEFSQSELQAIDRQREQAERRFDVGLVPITDVRTAQAQYDLAVAQEIAASDRLQAAQEALRVIAGIEVENLARLVPELPLARPEPADIDAWVRLATEQNLELVSARLAAESAAAQIAVERGQRLPTVDLVVTGAQLYTAQTSRPDASSSGEIELRANLPLYTGGRIRTQVAQARADAESAARQSIGAERAAVQRARDGYRGVSASIARVRALRQALTSTQQSADAVEAGFRAGTRTSVDVLQALRDVYGARSDYAGARYDYLLNSLQLEAAAGTLDERDLDDINRFLLPGE